MVCRQLRPSSHRDHVFPVGKELPIQQRKIEILMLELYESQQKINILVKVLKIHSCFKTDTA